MAAGGCPDTKTPTYSCTLQIPGFHYLPLLLLPYTTIITIISESGVIFMWALFSSSVTIEQNIWKSNFRQPLKWVSKNTTDAGFMSSVCDQRF